MDTTFATLLRDIAAGSVRAAELNAARPAPLPGVAALLADIAVLRDAAVAAQAALPAEAAAGAAPAQYLLDAAERAELLHRALLPEVAVPGWLSRAPMQKYVEYLPALVTAFGTLPAVVLTNLAAGGITPESLRQRLELWQDVSHLPAGMELRQQLLDIRAAVEGVLRLLGLSRRDITNLWVAGRA